MAMNPRARSQRLEMVIGIVGFFALAALVNVVASLVQGKPVLMPMVVLVAFTALLGYAVRVRRRS
jgi:lipopolysaccharide export LptBFGC system permease protein LptF